MYVFNKMMVIPSYTGVLLSKIHLKVAQIKGLIFSNKNIKCKNDLIDACKIIQSIPDDKMKGMTNKQLVDEYGWKWGFGR